MHENLILIGNTFEAVLLLFVLLEIIDVSVITVESLLYVTYMYMQCWCNFAKCPIV